MDELYRSDNVVVRRIATTDQSRWVITFDNYGIGPGFERPGFGEEFLRQSGLSAIHVLGRGDDWYQYPEMTEATAAVRAAVAGADRVMTYGSSMGGYAALRFADAVDATAVLALSPQYSLDPVKVPDRRWSQDSDRIRWLAEFDGVLGGRVRPVVVYDPVGLDGWHGRRIGEEMPITAVRLRHTAHPVTTYLAEIGLLAPLVFQTLDGTVDGKAMERLARQRRNASSVYLGELATLQPQRRSATAMALAQKAVELSPLGGHARISLARLLTQAGRHDEALALHRELVASQRFIVHLIHYADALLAAGHTAHACLLAREVLDLSPNAAHLRAWAGFVFWAGGEHDDARECLKVAVGLDPSNVQYQKLLNSYRFGAPDPGRPGGTRPPPWLRVLRWWNDRRSAETSVERPRGVHPISES